MFDSKKLAMEIANGEKEETGSLEFKSHLGTSNPQQYQVNHDGHLRYRIDTEKLTFKGIKELQQYFQFVNCIKPVCAFLNTKGGVLAIGFNDFLNENGMREATGLINETEKDEDTFQKEVLDILESKFQRSVVNNFIEVFIERVGSKKVCLIKVDKTDDAVFVEKFKVLGSTSKEPTLFVRSGNSSRELTDPKDIYHHGKVQGHKRGQVSEKPSQEKDCIEKPQSFLRPFAGIETLENELRKINTPPFQKQKYIANAAKLLSVVKTKRGSKDCVEISLDDGSKRARMWDIDEVFTVCRKLIGLRVITEPRPQKHNQFEWFNNIYIDNDNE